MKKLAILLGGAAVCCASFAQGQHYVAPHVTRDGTYVEGHYQTNPDSSRQNNWSTQGNVNPYTGQAGTVNPYQQPQMPRGSMYETPAPSGLYQMPGLPRARY